MLYDAYRNFKKLWPPDRELTLYEVILQLQNGFIYCGSGVIG